MSLAVDLGFLVKEDKANRYEPHSLLCRLLRTPHERERVAILRIVLESFEPFLVFREELEITKDPAEAARRTKTKLALDSHREDIKDTLLSLATYSGALKAGQGNSYERDTDGMQRLLQELSSGSGEESSSIHAIREELGEHAANQVDHENVIIPLATALRHAFTEGLGREAVVHASNAIESFLTSYAESVGVDLQGASGVNAKVDRLKQQRKLPKKLQFVGKYIGPIP